MHPAAKKHGSFELPKIDDPFDSWLKVQLNASPSDGKDTDEFKYITFTELPPWTEGHKSLMRKAMTAELFDKLKNVQSAKVVSLCCCHVPHLQNHSAEPISRQFACAFPNMAMCRSNCCALLVALRL